MGRKSKAQLEEERMALEAAQAASNEIEENVEETCVSETTIEDSQETTTEECEVTDESSSVIVDESDNQMEDEYNDEEDINEDTSSNEKLIDEASYKELTKNKKVVRTEFYPVEELVLKVSDSLKVIPHIKIKFVINVNGVHFTRQHRESLLTNIRENFLNKLPSKYVVSEIEMSNWQINNDVNNVLSFITPTTMKSETIVSGLKNAIYKALRQPEFKSFQGARTHVNNYMRILYNPVMGNSMIGGIMVSGSSLKRENTERSNHIEMHINRKAIKLPRAYENLKTFNMTEIVSTKVKSYDPDLYKETGKGSLTDIYMVFGNEMTISEFCVTSLGDPAIEDCGPSFTKNTVSINIKRFIDRVTKKSYPVSTSIRIDESPNVEFRCQESKLDLPMVILSGMSDSIRESFENNGLFINDCDTICNRLIYSRHR